jgi:hypothetical protein
MLGGSGAGMQRSTKENYSLKNRIRDRYNSKIDAYAKNKRKLTSDIFVELSESERRRSEQKSKNDLIVLKLKNKIIALVTFVSIVALTGTTFYWFFFQVQHSKFLY